MRYANGTLDRILIRKLVQENQEQLRGSWDEYFKDGKTNG